jgi:hypothetical protein
MIARGSGRFVVISSLSGSSLTHTGTVAHSSA